MIRRVRSLNGASPSKGWQTVRGGVAPGAKNRVRKGSVAGKTLCYLRPVAH